MIQYIIPIIFLTVLSIIDIKTFKLPKGFIPSFLTTLFIIISFLLSMNPIIFIMSCLLALFLYDMKLYDGEPDIKCIIACGCVMPNLMALALFVFLVCAFGFGYKYMIIKANKKIKNIAFIPVIFFSYFVILAMLI